MHSFTSQYDCSYGKRGAATFFGIPLRTVTYSASVIPILLAIYCMSFVQKFCYKVIPETFRYLFTPPVCVIVIVPVTLLVFGPLGSFVGGWLAKGYEWIYNLSPMVAGMFIGALQPFMVILGLHWGLFPIALNNVAVYGYDTIMALFGGAIFAQEAQLSQWQSKPRTQRSNLRHYLRH